MSESSTLVTAAHFEYLAARTTREDAFLASLKKAAHEAGLPPISIAPEQGAFMQILLRAAGVKEVVEVGTLAGYSAIWMARALPQGGRVRTIEYAKAHAEFARAWIAKSDVAERVTVFEGKGIDVLPQFADGSADAAFLDADKSSYPAYLEQSLRIVRKGGLILVDNAFAFGQLLSEHPKDREVAAVRAFNDQMAKESRLTSIILPIGDGLWLGVKK
jgi:predicted O-methyltransferase YrrM